MVHNGEQPGYVGSLVINLHSYVDGVVGVLTQVHQAGLALGTIDEALVYVDLAVRGQRSLLAAGRPDRELPMDEVLDVVFPADCLMLG